MNRIRNLRPLTPHLLFLALLLPTFFLLTAAAVSLSHLDPASDVLMPPHRESAG